MATPTGRRAAVLVLLYPKRGKLHLILTKRTKAVETHKGEISLPGGAADPGEELLQAALRETREELGMDTSSLEILAQLDRVDTARSGFEITPFVAYNARVPTLKPNLLEVEEVIELPVETLADPAIFREEEWTVDGRPRRMYFYTHGRHEIWGATARVLRQFLSMFHDGLLPLPGRAESP